MNPNKTDPLPTHSTPTSEELGEYVSPMFLWHEPFEPVAFALSCAHFETESGECDANPCS